MQRKKILEMTIHPIIFSAPMIRALLDGRKTQTRRIIKLPRQRGEWEPSTVGGGGTFRIGKNGEKIPTNELSCIWNTTTGHTIVYDDFYNPPLLWVKEAWQVWHEYNGLKPSDIPAGSDVLYLADRPNDPWDARKRHARFMPRWASRLTLEITDVRVRRLQDISEEDARAEGIYEYNRVGDDASSDTWGIGEGFRSGTPREAFKYLWESIHGPGSWDANPFVWALTFKVHHCNVDAVMKEVQTSAP